jgi:proteic killer suppression protein
MDIMFISRKLEKEFNTHRKLVRSYGPKRAKLIERRMNALRAADSLDDMRLLPGRCHELRENRSGQLAVSLDGPYRLVFEPANDPIPTLPDGGLDWSRVTAVRILEVVNYHGK